MISRRTAVGTIIIAAVLAFALLAPGLAGGERASAGVNSQSAVTDRCPDPSSRWMGSIADVIGGQKLNEIALPGTHDSGTYRITPRSRLADDGNWSWVVVMNDFLEEYGEYLALIPGATMLVKFLFAKIGPEIQAGWSRCQNTSIRRQLNDGIRYLDFRVLADGGRFFLIHSMYSVNMRTALSDIRRFATRPGNKEVVIVDINHTYQMGPAEHEALVDLINRTLVDWRGRSLLIERGSDLTLENIWEDKPRVIVLYQDESTVDNHPELWYNSGPNRKIISNWPNTTDIPTLLDALKGEMESEEIEEFQANGGFYVLQAVRTPDEGTIVDGITSALWQESSGIARFILNILYALLGLAKDAPTDLEELAEATNPGVWRSIMDLDGQGAMKEFGNRANIIILDHYYYNEVLPDEDIDITRYIVDVNVSRYSAARKPVASGDTVLSAVN